MATYETNLKVESFKGVRAVNPIVDVQNTGQMSAALCKNIELKYSGDGDCVGIYTMKGNFKIAEIPGKMICDQWESIQKGVSYWIVYAVDEVKGYLYHYKPSAGTFELLYGDLSPVYQCNGLTMAQGFDDLFVFTNGVDDYLSINMSADEKCKPLNAEDAEERKIRGLILKVQNGRLCTNSANRMHWCQVGNIYDWRTSTTGLDTNPAYQEFDRPVTAAETYGDALVVFTDSYSVQFKGNPAKASDFTRTEATGGGCVGFKAVLKYDNKLFYYDGKAKNVFAYYLYDNGQTRPTDGLANNILKYFSEVDKNREDEIAFVGFASGVRNEIWVKFPTLNDTRVLVFDYLKQEWLPRDMGNVNSLSFVQGQLCSAVDNALYQEYTGNTYCGIFRPSEYVCNTINLGSDSNLKIPKLPMILTFDDSYTNNFTIEFMLNDNPKSITTKRIEKSGSTFLIWAKDDGSLGGEWATDDGQGGYMWNYDDALNVTHNLFGLIPWKRLRIRIYTEQEGDEFGLKRIEMKKVKVKTKTVA